MDGVSSQLVTIDFIMAMSIISFMNKDIIYTDFLVIGSGIAGLWFALKVAEAGKVIVITKKEKSDTNTNYAQGGIASALGPDDSPHIHFEDTIRTGDGLSHEDAVKLLTERGPELVKELFELGINFSLKNNGNFDLGMEGGHSRRRIVHAKDYTGAAVEMGLLENVKKHHNIKIFENFFVKELLVEDNICYGAIVMDRNEGKEYIFLSKITFMASGGAGWVYKNTTNPEIATGDGIAMAFRAGAIIGNMEFVQFHPTSLAGHLIKGRAFLISEALRGEGAILLTKDGERFMHKYDPRGELAPRDIVARAIYHELKRTGDDYVILKISHIGEEKVKEKFPHIYETCLSLGIDITKEGIPVVPAAHYICGGIKTDLYARTSIERLLAGGECAFTGVHGANRLASNSLLEALVFSEQGAEFAKNTIGNYGLIKKEVIHIQREDYGEDEEIKIIREKVREKMWEYAGIVREEKSLKKGIEELKELYCELMKKKKYSVEFMELKNMLTVGLLIMNSAIRRKESRGLHFMKDYPYKDDKNFKHDTLISLKDQILPDDC